MSNAVPKSALDELCEKALEAAQRCVDLSRENLELRRQSQKEITRLRRDLAMARSERDTWRTLATGGLL